MTFARVKELGSGELRYRLQIEGFPYEFVTHIDMEAVTGDGKTRYVGLRADGIKLKEEVDIPHARWDVDGFTAVIVDVNNRATEAFGKKPSALTYLAATDISDTATSIAVEDTSDFPTAGYIHIDTEAIKYVSKTSAAFNVSSAGNRGVWDTLAQYHYNTLGAETRYVEVTDHPPLLEGRKVRLYAYGPGDGDSSSGTQIWVGIVGTEPAYDGLEWTFSVDSVARILDQDIGADAEQPTEIRGIYYPDSAPLFFRVFESLNTAFANFATKQFDWSISGFFETQDEFIEYVNEAIEEAWPRGGFDNDVGSLYAANIGSGWGFVFDPTTNKAINVYGIDGGRGEGQYVSLVDGSLPQYPTIGGPTDPEIRSMTSLSLGNTYKFYLDPPIGRITGNVPRMAYGEDFVTAFRHSDHADFSDLSVDTDARGVRYGYGSNPAGRVYLSGDVPTDVGQIEMEFDPFGERTNSGPVNALISAVNNTDNYVDTTLPFDSRNDPFHSRTFGGAPYATHSPQARVKITLTRDIGAAEEGGFTFRDFLNGLVSETKESVNKGGFPKLDPALFNLTAAGGNGNVNFDTLHAENRLYQNRAFQLVTGTSLKDVMEEECKLLGIFPRLDTNGKISFRLISAPSPGDAASNVLSSGTIIVEDSWFTYEKQPLGTINTVEVKTKYNAVAEEHLGETFRIRDVTAYGRSPVQRALEVAPLSRKLGERPTFDDVSLAFHRLFAAYGGPHFYLTVNVSMKNFDTLVGDIVRVDWDKIPNDAGTLGITGKLGVVVSREWDLGAGRGQLTIYMSDQKSGGYVPSTRVNINSGVSGGTGPFVVSVYTSGGSMPYIPTGVVASDLWATNDLVRFCRWNSTNTTEVNGTVTAVSTNTITVTTDSNWSHTGLNWYIDSRASTAVTSLNQKIYAYIAGSDNKVNFSDEDVPPYTIG